MSLWSGDVYVLRATDKALLMTYENESAWIPMSQIHDNSEVWKKDQVGETGRLVIPEWLAKQKGWL